MNQTLIPQVLDGLVAACRADTTLTGLKCQVFDGPYLVDLTSDTLLVVGGTGLDDDEDTSARSDQSWAHANTIERDETITVQCAAWAGSGDTDMRPRRDRAAAVVARVSDIVRSESDNPTDGAVLGVPGVLWAELASVDSLRQVQTELGATAVFTFTVSFRCRI